MKILPIKAQKNCCMSPNKAHKVFGLKQHRRDHSVHDIKVQQERLENIFIMSNKSCCFAFLLKCPYYGCLKIKFNAVCNTALSE